MVRRLFAFAMWGVLGLLSVCPVGADEPAAGVVPVSALFADEAREVFRLSPDGSWVAFLHFDGSINRLCVADPKNLAATTLTVTGSEEGGISSFLWIEDSQIAFASRCPNQQTLIGSVLIPRGLPHAKAPSTAQVRILREGKNSGELTGIISKRSFQRVLVAIPSENGDGISDIIAVDPATGESKRIHRNVELLPVLSVSRNGEALAGIRCSPDGEKQLLSIHAGKTKELLSCRADESLNIAGLNSQGSVVYVMTDQGAATKFIHLEAIDISTGKRTVIGDASQYESDLHEAVFDWDMNRVLACRFYRDRPEYFWLSAELENLFDALRQKLPTGDIRLRDSSRNGKKWLLSVTQDTEPDAEYFYDSELKSLIRLDSRSTSISAASLGRMKTVRYQARDQQTISAYLTLPAGGVESNLPVVVFPHGGPNMRNYWGYDPRVQFFASRGYAVFQPNYRGSSGFGKAFQNAGNGQWGRGVMQDDISDGVAWLVERGIADPKRIAIVGGSYGGYAAMAGLAFTPDLYACGVCLFGPSNLSDFIREIPDKWKPFYGDLAAKIGNPDLPADSRRLDWQSPARFTYQIRVPIMVYHGARDEIIRPSQADNFVAACRANRVKVDYLFATDEAHGFANPLNEQAVYIAIERFLATYLGGQSQHEVSPDVEKRLENLRAVKK